MGRRGGSSAPVERLGTMTEDRLALGKGDKGMKTFIKMGTRNLLVLDFSFV